MAHAFNQLLVFAFLLGLAGSSFAVGVGFVSRWFPPERQGTALGIFGLGNMGHFRRCVSGAGCRCAVRAGRGILRTAALAAAWAFLLFGLARNARQTGPPASLGPMLRMLAAERLSWALSLRRSNQTCQGGAWHIEIHGCIPEVLRTAHSTPGAGRDSDTLHGSFCKEGRL